MGTIINDVVDYDNKIDLLRLYIPFYTEEDLDRMFGTGNTTDILTKFTYNQIRAILVNTLQNTVDKEFDIGDVVVINKAVLKDNMYQHHEGLIIGKHRVYDDYFNNKEPFSSVEEFNQYSQSKGIVYHEEYDILCQVTQYPDGYGYDVRRERARDLILTAIHIDNVDKLMSEYSKYVIDRPV